MNAADFPRLGLGEAIERLDAMPRYLEAALRGADANSVRFRPAPGEFSLVEHACHLRDLEREGYLVRVRRMLAEDCPALEGFDGGALARERDYQSQDARIAAQEFAAARRSLAGMLAPLTERELAREATFEGKRICMVDLIAMIADHDRSHREEIERLMEAIAE